MRLIDADALDFDGMSITQIADAVQDAPTVYAVQVHGRWNTVDDFDGDVHYQCSACGEEWVCIDGTPAENNMFYCPRCGAKMDLEADQAAKPAPYVRCCECKCCEFDDVYGTWMCKKKKSPCFKTAYDGCPHGERRKCDG